MTKKPKTMEAKYFELNQLDNVADISIISDLQVLSTDSYSDAEVYKAVKKAGAPAIKLLLCCALQLSIVGSGNKAYGKFMLGGETVDVSDIFSMYNVKTDASLKDKLNPGELTPRRLQRLFRKQISDYIVKNPSVEPYLWAKYSTHDAHYKHICFPGAESLITKKDEALYLCDVYNELDKRNETKISDRVHRVFLTRGIIQRSDIKVNIVN